MKRFRLGVLTAVLTMCLFPLAGCAGKNVGQLEALDRMTEENTKKTETDSGGRTTESEKEAEVTTMENIMYITVGDIVFTAELADNTSAQAWRELLQQGSLTIDMKDYANMEKVGPIETDLPQNNEEITTGPGDIILYQGNSIVIYYDTNTWNFTRLGKINNVTQAELKKALGNGNVTVTWSLE